MNRRLIALSIVLAFASGCSCLQPLILRSVKGKDLLETLNTSGPGMDPPFVPVDEEVKKIFHNNLPDAYWDAASASAPLRAPEAVGHIRDAIVCAETAKNGPEELACLDTLNAKLAFPKPPKSPDMAAWKTELDTVRMMENLGLAVRASATWFHSTQQPPITDHLDKLQKGIKDGLDAYFTYLPKRAVKRHLDRPVTAFVMSGGAANGAYSAGATWFLLQRQHACKTEAEAKRAACEKGGCSQAQLDALERSCLSDRVDIAAGTSTGSLITILVKDFFAEKVNHRQRALDMLFSSYTCSVNSDLYCAVDTNLYELFQGKARGLVRFDGISKRLDDYVGQETWDSPTEYFASAVDYKSGRIHHFSSADPADIPTLPDLRKAVLSSIVEPGLAEPVEQVGPAKGTLVDGGVRSGLPLRTPLARGAERAVMFVNAPMETVPLERDPANGGEVLLRTLSLFVHQPIVGELHEAEHRLLLKRISEYSRCMARVKQAGFQTPASVEDLCSGREWPEAVPVAPEGRAAPMPRQVVTQTPSPVLRAIPTAYQSVWLFQRNVLPKDISMLAPGVDWRTLTLAGYQFDPKAMWNLFALGALEAQEQCQEINRVLGWHLTTGEGPGYCGTYADLSALLRPLRDQAEKNCWGRKNEQRMCTQ
jgi:predicted acylesterase/phospholipase RssA